MYLYSLLLPPQQYNNISDMYFRTSTVELVEFKDNRLDCKKGSVVSFDTYFNAFSIEKWKKYTLLKTLNINIDFKGSYQLFVYDSKYKNRTINKFKVIEKKLCSNSRCIETVQIPLESFSEMMSFSLIGLKNSFFYGGFYSTDENDQTLPEVNIAVTMCTYHREMYVEHNIKILTREIFENSKSPLKEHLKIYLADNGQSLDINHLSNNYVKIFPQPSYGGSGGFVRGILELLHEKEIYGHTHILIMDDDVTIEPQAFEKNYSFLRLIKSEFSDRQIGGAMLRNDTKNIQSELSGIYKGYGIESIKPNLDLNKYENVIFNEREEAHDYQAWFYTCIPIKTYLQNGFSLPFFMKYDDVEYGLRLKPSITLNGIFVWHDGFEYKRNGIAIYYSIRNMLIVNALYKRAPLKRIIYKECKQIGAHIALARYKFAEIQLMAIRDFCKGPSWLLYSDARKKYEDLSNMDYKYVYLNSDEIEQYKKILKRKKQSKEKMIVSDTDAKTITMCKAKKIIYFNKFANFKYETTKDACRSMKLLCQTMRDMISLFLNYRRIAEQYRQQYPKMCSEKVWRDYLNYND